MRSREGIHIIKILNGEAGFKQALESLRQGKLVAIPTETVYGLAGRADQASTVDAIYRVKGRPSTNPLIVHVSDSVAAQNWVTEWPKAAEKLAQKFWPGPLTLILNTDDRLPSQVRAGLKTVGLRVPRHPLAQKLLHQLDFPLAAPSANRSGHISPTRAEHVARSLGSLKSQQTQDLELIFDGGSTDVGVESTIVDLTNPTKPLILRPGSITGEDLKNCLGIPVPLFKKDFSHDQVQPSPGLLSRHYAPDAMTVLFDSHDEETLNEEIAARLQKQEKAALLLCSGNSKWLKSPNPLLKSMGLSTDPKVYAREIYGSLHEAEDWGARLIAIELPPQGAQWDAIHDRLRRAASTD